MASFPERKPRSGENLIFSNPEDAQEFEKRIENRAVSEQQQGVTRRHEIIQEELGKEFEKSGEGVTTIKTPWEHTPQEHEDVQQLVHVAFEKDLPTAIDTARKSKHYPRNLDLFHDVLTTEMYDAMRSVGINKQPVGTWSIAILGIVVIVLGAIAMFVFI